MNIDKIRILGTGSAFPDNLVSSEMLDIKLQLPLGTTERISGVRQRYFITPNSSVAALGARASLAAIASASLQLRDIDLIVSANFSGDMLLPYKASLVQKELGLGRSGIPCFDVDATCLSFIVALQLVGNLLRSGCYKNVLIVSAEASSTALNWNHLESAALFGDGACAMVVGLPSSDQDSAILNSRLETYGDFSEVCTIKGGGVNLYSRHFQANYGNVVEGEDERFLFAMDGKKAYRFARQYLEPFLSQLLTPLQLSINDFNLVVPHQASLTSLKLLKRKLNVRDDQWVSTVEDYGNMIAASIPFTLHHAIMQGRVQRSDKVLLVGTSAGLSIGGIALVY